MPGESLSELMQEFLNLKKFHHFEGDSGMENLNETVKAMGYKGHGFRYGSPLESFLSDNPGAQQAILDWICDQDLDEWKEAIESELPEKDEEDLSLVVDEFSNEDEMDGEEDVCG